MNRQDQATGSVRNDCKVWMWASRVPATWGWLESEAEPQAKDCTRLSLANTTHVVVIALYACANRTAQDGTPVTTRRERQPL
jgi:hypothetical protein